MLLPGISRGIRVLEAGAQVPDGELPVMDDQAFLRALESADNEGDDGDVPEGETLGSLTGRLAAPPERFLLITEETAGLRYGAGDLVAISREREPHDGEGVVTRIDGKLRLETFREHQGAREIQVQNPTLDTAEANGNREDAEEAEVLAIVVGGIITTGMNRAS